MTLRLSTSPHLRSPQSSTRLMLNVIIALLPSAAFGVYNYGYKALMLILVSMLSAVVSEYLWQRLTNRPVRIKDCSALVTGMILALCVTPEAPWWMLVVGSAFAIIVVKELFGGIGDNFINPALAARAMLLASWPMVMTRHIDIDGVSSATPLAEGAQSQFSYLDLLIGRIPGVIGETCKLAIIVGIVYLIVSRTVTWRIPVFTILSAFVMAWIVGLDPVYHVLSGGIIFAAAFMANDYTTSPMTRGAQMVYASGIGIITIIIRKWGAYPEGATYAVLFMNLLTPLLDRYIPHRVYGHSKREAKN
ncbi:MAG: RnfABCDGE type electron transport complex subunit D [Clostridia bacterium]|nr:RnfABCDGE type electron transport complex subunit D [Clostridia bacterium]